MAVTDLNQLDTNFRQIVNQMLAAFTAAGIEYSIIQTLRTQEEHQANLAKGTSKIKRSLHMDGLAIDVVPKSVLSKPNWAPTDPIWEKMGLIGEGLGLEWGGRWKKLVDKPHFQVPQSEVAMVNGRWKWKREGI